MPSQQIPLVIVMAIEVELTSVSVDNFPAGADDNAYNHQAVETESASSSVDDTFSAGTDASDGDQQDNEMEIAGLFVNGLEEDVDSDNEGNLPSAQLLDRMLEEVLEEIEFDLEIDSSLPLSSFSSDITNSYPRL
jgi:hypothetical protein